MLKNERRSSLHTVSDKTTDLPHFDQVAYWRERHRKYANDPRSVGRLDLTIEANLDGERQLQETAAAFGHMFTGSVLDIGCGYGRLTAPLIAAGMRYTGVDVSPEAVARATQLYPSATFVAADLLTWDTAIKFDLILAFYVFVHFVDDGAWQSIVRKSLSWLRDTGVLVIADVMPTEKEQRGTHYAARTVMRYTELLDSCGSYIDREMRTRFARAYPTIKTSDLLFVR
jgi:SAM-dependent methyltransferase